jgi:RNA-directed DNA polymerase
MKRVGKLWPAVLARENLLDAFHKAARGKRRKIEVWSFSRDLDRELELMRAQLLNRSFETGRFHVFKVYDPKERTIHAARFPERVFHHAVMNVCEPFLDRRSVYHSYACRKGKGRLAAVEAALVAARGAEWYLKLDIRKYFESIPHGPLLAALERVFKDPDLLYWFGRIVRGHRGEEGRGLPIGSLTSQHFANFHLGALDRLCQEDAGTTAYVRYMDDFVCWSHEKAVLQVLGRRIESLLSEKLGLELKHSPSPQPAARGMDFLGYRLYPDHVRLARRSKTRYLRRMRLLARLSDAGVLSEDQTQTRLTAATAFLLPARSHGFRGRALAQLRSVVIGHEPGEPGRQLEQQRQQLPRREPQQQQPDELEQQHRVPGGPQLRPSGPDGRRLSKGLNRSPSSSSRQRRNDKTQNAPSGAGRPAEAGSKAPGGSSASDVPPLS